jgi:short-subunit dehydrogenase
MEYWLNTIDWGTPIDLIIANAGISAGSGIHGENGQQVHDIFSTNINGVVNTVQPLIPAMIKRGRGQIAIMSSLAGMRGLPSCPAYSASKACVKAYGEGLRGWLGTHGVQVSVICPGYIKTPLTSVNDFPMPFLMEPSRAARIIAQRLRWNQSRIAFPLILHVPLWLMSCLSPTLTDWFFARLPAKPAVSGK